MRWFGCGEVKCGVRVRCEQSYLTWHRYRHRKAHCMKASNHVGGPGVDDEYYVTLCRTMTSSCAEL